MNLLGIDAHKAVIYKVYTQTHAEFHITLLQNFNPKITIHIYINDRVT